MKEKRFIFSLVAIATKMVNFTNFSLFHQFFGISSAWCVKTVKDDDGGQTYICYIHCLVQLSNPKQRLPWKPSSYGFVDRPWVYPSVVPLQVPILKGECGSILAPKIANYASNVMSLSSISWQTNASYDKSLKTFDKVGEMVHFCLNSMSD